jgi:hypothetical protein
MVLACDVRPILSTYNEIRYEGKTFPVNRVVPNATPWDVFQKNATNLSDSYNTVINGIGDYYKTLHAGSVFDVSNDYYNMIDPTGYVFPEANHSTLLERIPVTETDKFLDFIYRRQPNWNLPVPQQIFNWISITTLIVEFGALITFLVLKWVQFAKLKSRKIK